MAANRDILFHKLHVILQRSLVESRNLALGRNFQQIYDLADTFEVLPSLMTHWKDENLDFVRSILGNYQARYRATAYDYLAILNMEDADFEATFQRT